jgi:Fe-S cluster biosynthesis and repair protein YggX
MLQQLWHVKEGMVSFKSGRFYSFFYQPYKNDPIPTVIMINAIKGTHPTTGHVHNYLQCINLSYIPRAYRARFVNLWIKTLENSGGNVKLTWNTVVSRFPFLKIAVRRYILGKHYIRYQREIQGRADIEREVISTVYRDYSQMAMKQLMIINQRMLEKNPKYHKNLFMKSLSKYLQKYRLNRPKY